MVEFKAFVQVFSESKPLNTLLLLNTINLNFNFQEEVVSVCDQTKQTPTLSEI